MKELDELLLLSGQDVPYVSAGLQIHQPRIKEIAMVGEKNYYAGIGLLKLDKSFLEVQDKAVLDNFSNFDIIMMMIQNSNPEIQIMKTNLLMVLAILFPRYTIALESKAIVLREIIDNKPSEHENVINSENYGEFCFIVDQVSGLSQGHMEQNYNAKSKMAQRIAEKLKKGRQKAAKSKGETNTSIIARYVSILAVGQQKDMNFLMNYTLPQLFDEYQRYSLKTQFDMNIQMRLAGAKDVESPKNWMDDLNEKSSQSF